MIRISVIIPTYNRRHVLERTLPGVLAQDFPPQDYEVIVVMDGSTDGTAELLRGLKPECSLRVLESQHRGAGAARNVGIHAALGELVLFLDDDLIAPPNLLRQHCASHSGADPCAVQGRMYIAPDSSQTIIRYALERIGDAYYDRLRPDMDLLFPEGMSSPYVLSYLVNSSMPGTSFCDAEDSMSSFWRLKSWTWDCVFGKWGFPSGTSRMRSPTSIM